MKTIVIGTSLSGASDEAVRTGVAVAEATGASVWLVHAYVPPALGTELAGLQGVWLEQQAEILRGQLVEQARRTGLAGSAAFRPDQLCPVMGAPVREIMALARKVKADLIVVGAVEGGALHRIFLGSTADGVIRKASCPVLAVHAASAFPPTRVEIPVDLSPLSAKALRHGLRFLAQLGVASAETEALLVLNPAEVARALHFTREQFERFASAELRRFLEENSSGAPPRLARVRTGDPREEILAVLAQRKVDLAILGTHGRTGLDRLTLGSVAAEVMHDAGCNLLVIPPKASPEVEFEAAEEKLQGADWTFVSDEAPASPGRS